MISPFQGFSDLQRKKLLLKLETHSYKFNKNEEILSNSISKNVICILIEGNAKIVNIELHGQSNDNYYSEDMKGRNLESEDVISNKMEMNEKENGRNIASSENKLDKI